MSVKFSGVHMGKQPVTTPAQRWVARCAAARASVANMTSALAQERTARADEAVEAMHVALLKAVVRSLSVPGDLPGLDLSLCLTRLARAQWRCAVSPAIPASPTVPVSLLAGLATGLCQAWAAARLCIGTGKRPAHDRLAVPVSASVRERLRFVGTPLPSDSSLAVGVWERLVVGGVDIHGHRVVGTDEDFAAPLKRTMYAAEQVVASWRGRTPPLRAAAPGSGLYTCAFHWWSGAQSGGGHTGQGGVVRGTCVPSPTMHLGTAPFVSRVHP